MDRRDFVKHTSMAAMTAALPMGWLSKVLKKVGPVGIQLYTLRDAMADNPRKTLQQLAAIGYREVESAGYQEGTFYGMKPKKFKKLLNKLDLGIKSGHCLTGAQAPEQKGTIINEWEMAVADAAEVGQEYLVCAYLFDFERTSLDDYKKLAELFNKAGEVCNQYGISFAYHNHDFEFMEMDGALPYDILLSEVDAANMKMELDLYWINKANKNPFQYFEKYSGRFPLWHVKDMDDTEEQFFTEVGNGVIDWEPIFQAAKQSGMKQYYVEQDVCRNHAPIESVKISYEYLMGMEY